MARTKEQSKENFEDEPKPLTPAEERVQSRRSKAALGGQLLLLGIFLCRPSFLMLFALMLCVFVMQIIPKHQVTVGVMSGLP